MKDTGGIKKATNKRIIMPCRKNPVNTAQHKNTKFKKTIFLVLFSFYDQLINTEPGEIGVQISKFLKRFPFRF